MADNLSEPSVPTPEDQTPATPPPVDGKNQLAGKAINQVRAGRDKFSRLTTPKTESSAADAASPETSGAAEAETIPAGARARLRGAGRAAAKRAKQAAQTVGRTVTKVIERATVGVWLPILLVITVIFVIIAAVVIIAAFSGKGGKGPPVYPTTEVQKSQAGLAAAFAGDKLAGYKVVHTVVQSEQKRYDTIAKLMQTNPGNGTVGATSADISRIKTELQQIDALARAQNQAKALEQTKITITDEKSVESKLPFGTWIAQIANGFATPGSPYHNDASICHLADVSYATTSNGKRGCALAVSVILNEAGVPQSIVLDTLSVWKNPILSTVVDRPATPDRNLAKSALTTLKPGDIVWWGSGSHANYAGALFDHIGIYVGNDVAVNNRSSQSAVGTTKLDRTDETFNGAKRYAP